ncbi:MAG: CoA transferase [Acidimicrobiales bacterium]
MLLSGCRVLDLTDHRGELGPWLLGRLGAEVVKVEPPGGTPARTCPPLAPGAPPGLESLQFRSYNDNKRSVELDLTGHPGRAALLELVAGADIMFESGPPAATAAAGIDEAALTAAQPELVHVLVTAFGADGPRADDPHSELTIAALGGPMSLQGVRERAPLKVSVPQVWRHAGAEAAVAALVGLHRRARTGEPQWIDVSAQAAMTWTMLNAMEADEVQGFDFERAGATLSLAVTIDLRRAAKDGYTINAPIGSTTGPLIPWLVEEGIVDASWLEEDWASFDHRLLSGEPTERTYDDLRRALDELCSRYTRHQLLVGGLPYGATLAPVNTIADLLAFEHLDVRRFWSAAPAPGGGHVRRVGGPVLVDGERSDQVSAPPELGEATAALRRSPWPAHRPSSPEERDGELPLAGVRVADFSWVGVGPITAKALADHGALVVRVESERRLDRLRVQPPFKDGVFGLNRSNFYGSFNTSKLSLALDLTKPAGLAAAKRLTDWADVVIDSFRPGTMERLGLGHDDIAATNPGVITLTTSLLGGGGPLSPLGGYGFHAGAIAGFTDLVGWPDLGPDGPWMAYTDVIAPRFLATALLAALDRRRRTGEGCRLEGAQLEIGCQFLAPELLDHEVTGRLARRLGNRDPHMAPQGAYPCAGEDEWCTLTVTDDAAWAALRAVLGEPDWARNPELDHLAGRQARHDELDERLAAWTRPQPAAEVERRLLAAGVPAGKVQRSRDLRVDPQYVHREFYRRLPHSEVGVVPYAGHQYRIRGYDNGPLRAAPMLGEHTDHVLRELLGLTDDEIAELAIADALG